MALVPYEEAFARISARLPVTPVESVPVADCVGLVSAEDIHSLDDVPPFDNTAVDGFAVRSTDVTSAPVDLAVVATIPAGEAPVITLEEGTCARIMTGAVIPDGADAVVMVEDTEVVQPGDVRVGKPALTAVLTSGPPVTTCVSATWQYPARADSLLPMWASWRHWA